MSKIEELINEYCPNGVEYKQIGVLANYEQPTKYIVNNTNYSDEYDIPVLTAGQSFVLGYTDEKHNVYNASKDSPVIIFDDFTGAFKWVDFPFKVKSSAMKMIKANEDIVDFRYLFHLMGWLGFSSTEHKRLWISIYSAFSVPVPPLEVQREIVRILDNFTELTARKKQYEYYSKRIIDTHKSNCEMVSIAELGKWSGGKTPSMSEKSFWDNGLIPWISSKDMKSPVLYGTADHITEKAVRDASMKVFENESVAIVTRSGILKHTFPVAYVPFSTTINQDIKALDVKENVSAKYVALVMQAYSEDIRVMTKKTGGTVDSLDFSKVLSYKIPLPDYNEQLTIEDELSKFESFCNDISDGLPVEIEARQKQYEYYRDKLLTFKEKEQ